MPTLLNPFGFGGGTLLEMITNAGLLANLAICLDAGDGASFNGTSQTWTDVSGNNQNFYRGSSSSAQGSDPTFNGVAGEKSANEYFSVDGGDYFIEASGLTFAESWHKNNAKFTVGYVMYAAKTDNPSGTDSPVVFSSFAEGVTSPGMYIYLRDAHTLNLWVVNGQEGGGSGPFIVAPDTFFHATVRDWRCNIFSVDETTGIMNRKYAAAAADVGPSVAYTNPSSNSSGTPYMLFNHDSISASGFWASGCRIAAFFAWNRALSLAELDALYPLIQTRFPTLP